MPGTDQRRTGAAALHAARAAGWRGAGGLPARGPGMAPGRRGPSATAGEPPPRALSTAHRRVSVSVPLPMPAMLSHRSDNVFLAISYSHRSTCPWLNVSARVPPETTSVPRRSIAGLPYAHAATNVLNVPLLNRRVLDARAANRTAHDNTREPAAAGNRVERNRAGGRLVRIQRTDERAQQVGSRCGRHGPAAHRTIAWIRTTPASTGG